MKAMKHHKMQKVSAELIVKFDQQTGSTHMIDRQEWGRLMAEKINQAIRESMKDQSDDMA